jgi:hypothetical protein
MLAKNAAVTWDIAGKEVTVTDVTKRPTPDYSDYSAGAVYADWATQPDMLGAVLRLMHNLVVRDHVPIKVVHQAFLQIDEYRRAQN